MVEDASRNFEVFGPVDFPAAVTSHIPNRGQHPVRIVAFIEETPIVRASLGHSLLRS